MKARGNRHQKWWTCMQCQARWERHEFNQTAQGLPTDLMNFGAYATMTYEEVATQHPAYCQWALQTMSVEEDISPQLKRFALYLIAREAEDRTVPMEHDPEGATPMPTWSEGESVTPPSTLGSEWTRP